MTLVTAWRRTLPGGDELLVASDSRLTGGMTWDCGPKVFPLSRGDAVLAFAGETAFAYPLLMQLLSWCDDFESARNRSIDLTELKGHMERTCTAMLAQVDLSGLPRRHRPDLGTAFQLLLAGYSWRHSDYRIWQSAVDDGTRVLEFNLLRRSAVFIGCQSDAARITLNKILSGRARKKGARQRLDWEPLNVLGEFISDERYASIGGAVQVAKVSRHLNAMLYATRGVEGEALTLRGRPLLDYERTQRLVLDSSTGALSETWAYHMVPKLRRNHARETPDGDAVVETLKR